MYPAIARQKWRAPASANRASATYVVTHTSTAALVYHVRLRVLAAARQWLSATEQVPLAGECGTTPKTLRRLQRDLADASAFACLPFADDLEDDTVYGPIVSRLLFFAELSAIGDAACGTCSAPACCAPQVYGSVQDYALRTRRRPAPHAGGVATADDLAVLLEKFVCDAVVLRAFVDFALPPANRPGAAVVEPRVGDGTASATEHRARPRRELKTRDDRCLPQWTARLAPRVARQIAASFLSSFSRQGSASSSLTRTLATSFPSASCTAVWRGRGGNPRSCARRSSTASRSLLSCPQRPSPRRRLRASSG